MMAMQGVTSSASVSALNQRKVKQPSSDSLEMPARRHRSGLAGLTACLGRAFTCFVPKREARTLRIATPVLRDPLITLKGWLLQAPEVDAEAFLGILYNDLGKFLKDTNDESQSTAWQCDRLRTAISLLEHAIKYAPKEDPSAVFAREALVDAKIKSRVLVQQAFSKATATNNRVVDTVSAESKRWPVLFNADQKKELAELLDFVIRQTENHGNTGWQAYLDGVERMSVLRSYGLAKTDQPQAK